MASGRRDRREEYGEDADAELMARADAMPGGFTVETRGDVIVYTETDERGQVRRAERSLGSDDGGEPPPLVWEDVDG